MEREGVVWVVRSDCVAVVEDHERARVREGCRSKHVVSVLLEQCDVRRDQSRGYDGTTALF